MNTHKASKAPNPQPTRISRSTQDPIEGISPLVPVEDDLRPIPASKPSSKQTSSSPASKIERPFLSVKRPENHPYTYWYYMGISSTVKTL
jgi:hypothetical protein